MFTKYWRFIILFFIFSVAPAQNNGFEQELLDSIQQLRKQLSNNKSFDLDKRLLYAKRLNKLSNESKVDSLILLSNINLIHLHLLKKNFEHSIKLSHKNLKLAYKLNDSLSLARLVSHLGYSYSFLNKGKDSSYYYYNKFLKNSKKLKKTEFIIDGLINIISLQIDDRDYLGSEASTIEAINLLKSLEENNKTIDQLVDLYNQMGINSKHQKLYNKAIKYHKKALEVNTKLSNKDLFETNYLYTKINIAEVYKEKKDYKNALFIYKSLLKDDKLLEKDPLSYVAILNNVAYNLFLSKTKGTKRIDSLFKKAYKISDSLHANYEIVAGGNDMAEFYHAVNKKDSALLLSKRSYTLGKDIRNYKEVSRSLLMLSKIEKGEAGKRYLYEHIKLNDSLLDVERASRNKFARIQFETDNYIDETERLTTQNILIVVIGIILLLIFMLLFIIKGQLTKNKVLQFEAEQQKANEEIYSLLLKQHTKIEEGRLQERHRISEELHDGILNKLSGSRLGLEFLSIDAPLDKEKYKFYINEVQNIEKEIRDIAHELKYTYLIPENDFIPILENYIYNQSKVHFFSYEINNEDTIYWEDINDHIKVNLYRIIQESIQNIIKHAKANIILINFYRKSNKLHLVINDNGIGFNTKQQHKGIGLKNIVSRSNKLKGKFHIDSNNKGTTLKIIIPFSF